jgi:hypothetical protein
MDWNEYNKYEMFKKVIENIQNYHCIVPCELSTLLEASNHYKVETFPRVPLIC